MEKFPVEVIGKILSFVRSARDVIRASATSRIWHEAFQQHLHTLSFCSSDWQGYRNVSITQLELMITRAIFQTSGLRSLLLSMHDVGELSPSTVLCWIMYTRGTLRELYYNIKTNPSLNVLEMAGRQRLEVLELCHHLLTGIEPGPYILIFPCLKCLALIDVTISAFNLCFLINSCPKLESLELIEIVISDALGLVEITAPLLKRIHFEDVNIDNTIVLEVDKIEDLYIKECSIKMFDVIGNGTLKHLMIEDMASQHLNIGDSVKNLETVDISYCTISWPKFYKMISKSAKLRELRLWDVMFDDDSDVVDLVSIAASFPMLSHLSLCYHLPDELLPYDRQGSVFENVVFLRVGWSILSESFADWVDGLLILCPNLKVLVINGVVLDLDHEECQMLGRFTTSIVRILRKYSTVEVRFEYDEF